VSAEHANTDGAVIGGRESKRKRNKRREDVSDEQVNKKKTGRKPKEKV
jgi:hypothetical protein